MIGIWNGPLTTHKNRLLIPGREADIDPAQAPIYTRLGYMTPAAPTGHPHPTPHHQPMEGPDPESTPPSNGRKRSKD